MPPILCEVCVDSLDGARAAAAGGADRIELCGDLTTGGITPSQGLSTRVCTSIQLPVMVMIRPRGGDFIYTDADLDVMCDDVAAARTAGASGVVFGALTAQATLDLRKLTRLCESAQGMDITFHRAFDVCCDPRLACQQLIDLGIRRVLTSGQQETALQGVELLHELIQSWSDQLTIMPGSGVRHDNVVRLLTDTLAQEVHFSGSRRTTARSLESRPTLSMGSHDAVADRPVTCEQTVSAICRTVRSLS